MVGGKNTDSCSWRAHLSNIEHRNNIYIYYIFRYDIKTINKNAISKNQHKTSQSFINRLTHFMREGHFGFNRNVLLTFLP